MASSKGIVEYEYVVARCDGVDVGAFLHGTGIPIRSPVTTQTTKTIAKSGQLTSFKRLTSLRKARMYPAWFSMKANMPSLNQTLSPSCQWVLIEDVILVANVR